MWRMRYTCFDGSVRIIAQVDAVGNTLIVLKLRVGPTSKPSSGRVSVPVKKASKSPILRSTSPPMDNEQDAHVIPYCYNSMQALPACTFVHLTLMDF